MMRKVLLACSVLAMLLYVGSNILGVVKWDGHSGTLAPAIAALGLVGVYAFGVRPGLVRWGATDEEVIRPYPGADIIPGATRGTTMSVTINAPPSAVWPWLVQMGVDRAIWYTWDYWRPWGRRSAERIHPEWQDISVGHRMPSTLDGSVWWEVAALEPERFLGLRMSVDLLGRPFDPEGTLPRYYTDSLWAFLLEQLPGERTRLVVSGYWAYRPKWLQDIIGFLFIEPSTWIMQTRQLTGLKRRAEREARRVSAVTVPGPGR
jgi:proline iminopeptidase